ncbi:MAG: RDD family protein [Bdellovibrionaceae bacterium]|nr:RDD family protein [Pseudobdellovibrionaceae bacterium]
MVIPDLSHIPSKQSKPTYRIAPVSDRVVSFVIDFLVFSPVIGLLVARDIRELRLLTLFGADQQSINEVFSLIVLGVAFWSVLLSMLFLWFWQATPGQRFLKIRVLSLDGQHLTLTQCFLRSLGFFVGLVSLGLLFFGVMAHSHRRALHDRLSDTIVTTLKDQVDPGPLPMEKSFFSSWGRSFVVALLLFIGISWLTAPRGQSSIVASSSERESILCTQLPEKIPMEQRLDWALGLFLLDAVDADCLRKETQIVLWNRHGQKKILAYFSAFILSDDKEEAERYAKVVCQDGEGSLECSLLRFWQSQSPERSDLLRRFGLRDVTSRVLVLKDSLENGNYLSASALMQDLAQDEDIAPFMEVLYVRLAWEAQEVLRNNRRNPASEELNAIVHRFKKRYGIK